MPAHPSATRRLPLLAALLLLASLPLSGPAVPLLAADKAPGFETHVQPLLAAKCGKCHSETVRKGGLDLSSIGGLRRGGESGESVVAESVDDSLLWVMIDGGGMPPEGQPALTANELRRIRDWLAAGAPAKASAEPVQRPLNQHDVLPIMLLRCVTCHGPQRRDGELDLRTVAGMRRGGASGPALIPGDPDASLMIKRIESQACPPRDLLLKYFVRRPGPSELDKLKQWIAAGAVETETGPDIANGEPDLLVTDEDRRHWAFQPPRPPESEATIDSLVARQLAQRGLDFSPADRDTLIRRVHLDLIGMPPTLEQARRWRGSEDPQWFRDMVEELLASPHYGERWGRYWLDIAGYADSEGGVSADPLREVAWKYRDYVIRAFNDDKPYDRFLTEQIAGDELADYRRATTVTDEMVDNLIATGFLRMGIDQTGSRTMNFVPERLGVIADAIDVLGSGVLGLTLECARCHSHKYDPLPHRDYYRFKAVLQGALDEHDWLTFKTRTLSVATKSRQREVATHNPPLLKQLKSLETRRKRAEDEVRLATLRGHYSDQTQADRQATLAALKVADNNRSLPQRILVERLTEATLRPDSQQPPAVLEARATVRRIEEEILGLRRQLAPPLAIRALWDQGRPSPTYILRRGDHDKPGPLVGPGVPSMLTDGRTPLKIEPPFPGGTPKSGRRLALARWLIEPRHPLTARVMVNRIWSRHFGAGLVATLDNFGVKGERPSHPQLLDLLAVEFVRRGWSVKEMHRLMMNSRTYRQASRVTDRQQQLDPQNRLLSRMPLRRMDAEALRDSLLAVSGKLDPRGGGPPDPVQVDREGEVTAVATAAGGWRRSVYLQYRRTEVPSLMATFDYPDMGPNCVARSVSTVSPQSLMLLNSRRVRELSAALAARVERLAGREGPAGRVTLVHQLALSRSPDDAELALGIKSLEQLERDWRGDRQGALQSYCHAILNSGAFLYVD